MDNDEKIMQKIMEMLIEMQAAVDAVREERKAYREKMAEADRKADKGRMDSDRKAFIEWMDAKTKATQAETKAILEKTEVRRGKRMEANMNDDRNKLTACQDTMEANPEEDEAVLERQRVHNEETTVHSLKDDQNETTAYNEATEKIETDSGMMQSAEEHQDVPIEEVTVMPVKGLKKRRRAESRLQGDVESLRN
jgi:hypothetical protein